jgi:cytochrome c556
MNKLTAMSAAVLIAASAGATVVAPVAAEEVPMDKVEQAVKYRQNVMSTMGGLVGTAVGRLRDGFEFGPGLDAVAAGLVATTADIPALFPEGTDFGETDATADVWSDAAGFADKAKEAADAAKAFQEAVASGEKATIMGAFKAVGDSCKGCHEAYRKQ